MVFIDRFYNIIVGVLLFIATAGLAVVVSVPTQQGDILGVHFINVGQGDGVLLKRQRTDAFLLTEASKTAVLRLRLEI